MKTKLLSGLALSLVVFANTAHACVIQDPSMTPTNVRSSPLGKIIDKLHDDESVEAGRVKNDKKGREWTHISYYQGDDYREGWVASNLINCSGDK